MPNARIHKGIVIQGSAAILLDQIAKATSGYMTQTDIESIEVEVYRLDTEAFVAAPSITVSDVVSDTLRTDNAWSKDNIGYNLAIPLSGDVFPTGGITYRVQVKIKPVAGDAFLDLWHLECIKIFTHA